MCQALGIDGDKKYENRGRPGKPALRDMLAMYSSGPVGDIGQFADGLLWALICVNRDAHARNYGLLLAGPDVRMGPLYDLQSSLRYISKDLSRRDLAMRYGTGFTVYNAGSDHALVDVAARRLEVAVARTGAMDADAVHIKVARGQAACARFWRPHR